MVKNRFLSVVMALVLMAFFTSGQLFSQKASATSSSKQTSLILATTTSTQDTGLLDVLIPMFEKENNVKVKTIAVGTGQALALGQKGEADVLLVHAPQSEQPLVDSKDVINRKRVMYNDFILVGPSSNPAHLSGSDIKTAFKKMYTAKKIFVSRGDDSGTDKKEKSIWQSLNIKPSGASYISTGQGMGATLQIAAQKKAYVLTDRGTFLSQRKKLDGMKIIIEGGKDLMNIYHVMQVNPAKHKMINSKDAKKFVDFMVSKKTQTIIGNFGKKEYGQALFIKYTE
ncbi:MAG: substrate-binding domain-containing protein [Bacillota bacterium]|nr:substrate-binding domain-containing protein [Bacillota bacterium]